MGINDFCRCCKKSLKIHGVFANTSLIFDRKSRSECIYERVLRLGLRLQNTRNKSYRLCRSCHSLIARLERDMPVFIKWTDDEGDQAVEECSSEASEKRDREPTPTETPRALKKFCPNLPTPTGTRTRSITECSSLVRPATDHPNSVNSVQMPDQRKGPLLFCRKLSAERMADAGLFMECVEEELEPWQQTQRIRTVKRATRKPAMVTRLLAPASAPAPAPALALTLAPVPAPAPVASTHMVLSGQTLSGNRVSSQDTAVPLLTNILTGNPAVVTRVLAPAFTSAPVPAPAPVASTHMVLSGQTLSGNRVSSQDTAVPLLTNIPSLPTPMASVPVTTLPSGFLLVVKPL